MSSPGVLAEPVPAVRHSAPVPLWRLPAFLLPFVAGGGLALSAPAWWADLSARLFDLEFAVGGWIGSEAIAGTAWFALPLVGFGCGLLASISPCVLPLVPLNVAAVGAADASGLRAVGLSARFVLGAALALAVLGLAGDLAGFLLIEQRGPVLLVAGVALVLFGLVALDLLPVPFAGRSLGGARRLGPVGAGAAFSLVTTPCASPFLGAVLAAAAAQGVPGLGVVSMLGFAAGYTALVFVGGVFGGALIRRLGRRRFDAPRAAAAALLIVAGLGFAGAGIAWF
jgi:cytochrome c-type biogenesis protein